MPTKLFPCFFLISIFFFTLLSNSFSFVKQDTTISVDQDTVEYAFSFIMFDFTYTNNKTKARENNEDNLPAFISDISYLHKSGVYSGFNYTNYINSDTSSYDIELTLGYQKSILNDFIDFDINYKYHNYTGIDDYKGINYNHVANFNTTLNYKILSLYADGDFYLDNKNFFTEFGLSNTLDFDNIITQGDFIFIQPTVSFTYGTDHWLYDIYKPYIENNNTYLRYYLYNQGYQISGLDNYEIFKLYLDSRGLNSNTYSFQGVDFIIPLTYSISSFSITAAWMYSIPSEKYKTFGMEEQSGYIISLSLIF